MKRLLLGTLIGFSLVLGVPARAVDVIDLYYGVQTWAQRFGGYRNYRVPVALKSGKTCVISLTAHVNPHVEKYTLLIHGFGDSRFMWWKFIERYKDHPDYASFIAVDLPLHGHSNCDSVDTWDEIVDVIDRAVVNFKRKPISRIIAQSMGVVPAALLAKKYPDAQQVWFTPPLMKPDVLKGLVAELLEIKTPVTMQTFMNRVLTKDRDFPDFLLKEMLARVARSQRLLRNTDTVAMAKRILEGKYNNLLIVTGGSDELVPPFDLDPRVAPLASREIQAVPCGHDILRACGEDVKSLVEQSRYRLDKAKY